MFGPRRHVDQLRARQATPPYLNPDLPANQRAADLVSRMSLDEKVSQLVNDAPAKVSVVVRNIGERAGDEVVQLCGRAVSASRPMPIEQTARVRVR